MLNCHRASELLSRAQDGPLSLPARLSLGFHLMMCVSCRRLRDQFERLRVILRADAGVPGESLSDDARDRLKAALREAAGMSPDDV